MGLLLPNPLPASTAASGAGAASWQKYPYTTLRKSLRLLIEDPDPLEELENDISYVYSGYAPISVRLVQCVAQKGGVLSNPTGQKDKKVSGGDDTRAGKTAAPAASTNTATSARGDATVKTQAHPIVGWKGFEDVVASIPGETADIVQSVRGAKDALGPSASTLGEWDLPVPSSDVVVFADSVLSHGMFSSPEGRVYDDGGVLPWGMHLHGDCRSSVGCSTEHWYVDYFVSVFFSHVVVDPGRKFVIATTGIVSGASLVSGMADSGVVAAGPGEVGI